MEYMSFPYFRPNKILNSDHLSDIVQQGVINQIVKKCNPFRPLLTLKSVITYKNENTKSEVFACFQS